MDTSSSLSKSQRSEEQSNKTQKKRKEETKAEYEFTRLNRNPNVAVIGYGFAGKDFHAYLINLVEGLHLYGVASRSEATQKRIRADLPNVRVFSSVEQCLEDENVDLVVVASPTNVHYEQCLKSLEAGKHVVTDKPACIKLKEFDHLVQVAKSQSKLFTVFQNRRLDGNFLTVKEIIASGKLGNVRWIEAARSAGKSGKTWKMAPPAAGGGRFYDLGSHLVDQMLQLFNIPVKTVYGRLHFDFPDFPEVDSHALTIISFEDGSTGIVDTSTTATVDKPRFYVVGDKGTYCKFGLDPQEDAMVAGDIDSAVESKESYGKITYQDGSTEIIPTISGRWRNYYENIAATLRSSQVNPLVSLRSVRRTVQTLQLSYKSATECSCVSVANSSL